MAEQLRSSDSSSSCVRRCWSSALNPSPVAHATLRRHRSNAGVEDEGDAFEGVGTPDISYESQDSRDHDLDGSI